MKKIEKHRYKNIYKLKLNLQIFKFIVFLVVLSMLL